MTHSTYSAMALMGLGLASGLLATALCSVQASLRPREGRRGLNRDRSINANAHFAKLEPSMRKLTPVTAALLPNRVRNNLNRRLALCGHWLGLDAEELSGLSALSAIIGLTAGVLVGGLTDELLTGALAGALAGLFLPLLRLGNATLERRKSISRALPSTIDLAALCMAAGLDFAGSLQAITDQSGTATDPMVDELQQILRALRTGHTRAHALRCFAQSVPLQSVEAFVAAVIQADEKGSPLTEVMQIQASTLRMNRSVAAEEAAARAAVLLILPMLLLMGSVLLLLIGPFLVNGFSL